MARRKKKLQIKIKNPGLTTRECKKMGYRGVTCECLKKLAKRAKKNRKWAGRVGIALMGLRKKGVKCRL